MLNDEQKNNLLARMHDMEGFSSASWWSQEASSIWESGEEPLIGEVGLDDYIIANAYSAVLQVLYLYAEREGVLQPFSMGLKDETRVHGVFDFDINSPNPVEYEYVLVMAEKYGWTFPEKYNFSGNGKEYSPHTSDYLELDDSVLLRMITGNGYYGVTRTEAQKNEKQFLKLKAEGNEAVLREFVEPRLLADAIACMVNPEWMDLQRRYFLLPGDMRDLLPYRETCSQVSLVGSGAADDFIGTYGDTLVLDDGSCLDFTLMEYFFLADEICSELHLPLISLFCSCRIGTWMEKADRKLKDFAEKLTALEKELEKGGTHG